MTAKITSLKNPVRASWIRELGFRLDAPPFVSGALEARKTLDALSVRKDELQTLTKGGFAGIYHAGREGRTWVDDPEYGVPFLSSSDILSADLSNLSLMSKKQVASKPQFVIRKGWTLITRSGTIGRTTLARSEMDGMACSEHVMRVVPDTSKVLPGYLYAYVSSDFGLPIVISGTYGSIIQSIEPQHIATLPVPRFGKRFEQSVHDLVYEAAELRSKASRIVHSAIADFEKRANLSPLKRPAAAYPFGVTSPSSRKIRSRFDAFFHSPFHIEAVSRLQSAGPVTDVASLSDSVIEPLRFKRVRTEDEAHGIPFFGTSAIMNVDPEASYLLVREHPQVQQCIVGDSTVLVPRSGQLSGIIGTAILPYGDLIGGAVTEDAIRINCATDADAGYLFIALTSEFGRRQLKARAFGSSIPHLDVRNISAVVVPELTPRDRRAIGKMGNDAANLRHEAVQKERKARTLVEERIKGLENS